VRNVLFLIGFLGLFQLGFSTDATAQIPQLCVDSTRIDPFFQCNDPAFIPVCGCNFVTYRNECVAFRNGGVNNILYTGVCQNEYVFADLYPNIVQDNINLYVQFYEKGSATIQIRDVFGNIKLTQNHLSIDNRQFTFSASEYRTGIYYVFVIAGNVSTVLKFVKI
jgi:hypothetical protein